MTDEQVTELETIEAPYGRIITLQDVAYESGMRILRVRIREGSRFTIVDLDESTTAHLAGAMTKWAAQAAE